MLLMHSWKNCGRGIRQFAAAGKSAAARSTARVAANYLYPDASAARDSGVTQSNNRVDPHGAPRGDTASRKRHNHQDSSEADKGERIAGRDP